LSGTHGKVCWLVRDVTDRCQALFEKAKDVGLGEGSGKSGFVALRDFS
jgi:hypothetical protein